METFRVFSTTGTTRQEVESPLQLPFEVKPTNGDLAKRLLCTYLGERFVRHVKDGIFLVCFKNFLSELKLEAEF